MDDGTSAWTTDPQGRGVLLPHGTWYGKILPQHPEVAACLNGILRTVKAPDHAVRDPRHAGRIRYYARGVGPSRWLMVVVSYEQRPARIVSAFATRKDPRSWRQ
jgi:hypothetical protein